MTTPETITIQNALKVHRSGDFRFALEIPAMRVCAGEVCIIAGRSGCGKTTLLDILGCISDFDRCGRFDISVGGRNYNMLATGAAAKARIRGHHMGYVLQQAGLLPFLTAWENILLPMKMAGRSEAPEQAYELASLLGLEEHLNKLPSALSIGQQQRVSIVRAMAASPAVLLADEPTGALDPLTAQSVRTEMLRIAKSKNTTVVLVTHDLQLFRDVGDRFYGFSLSKEDNVVRSILTEQQGIY